MDHINMSSGSLLISFAMFGAYCPVRDLFTMLNLSHSTVVNLSRLIFPCISRRARVWMCVVLHFNDCVCVCACRCVQHMEHMSGFVFVWEQHSDMTRGDLPSVFSILLLSWHVESSFSVVMVTVVIDSLSVPWRQICVRCFSLLSELFLSESQCDSASLWLYLTFIWQNTFFVFLLLVYM